MTAVRPVVGDAGCIAEQYLQGVTNTPRDAGHAHHTVNGNQALEASSCVQLTPHNIDAQGLHVARHGNHTEQLD